MPPNILFLLVDCLRADRVLGQRSAVTPVLDKLRAQGITFSQVIASASSTTPCVAGMFTGLYPFAHGLQALTGLKLRPGTKTLASRLAEMGYHTVAEVTGPLSPETGLQQGFASFTCRTRLEYFSERWGDTLIERLKSGALPEPWFLFLHAWELHLPRRVPLKFNSKRYGATLYDRALSALDGRIGEVLAAAGPNTLALVHGDHGEGLMERPWDAMLLRLWQPIKSRLPPDLLRAVYRRGMGLFGRGRRTSKFSGMGHAFELYDYLIRVPLILRGPGVPAGLGIDDQARQVDILPTLCELVGGPRDWSEHGVATEAGGFSGKVSLRQPPYKLVCSADLDPATAVLFDLANDPDETHSIAADRPDLTREMLTSITALRQRREAEAESAPAEMDEDEMAVVNARLRDLGYLE
jgi:arylsulfatase A-like enzyme